MSGDWVLSDDQRLAKNAEGVQLRFEKRDKPTCSGCYFVNRISEALPCTRGVRDDELSGIWTQINK